jgi:beta-glucosidase
VTLEPGEEKEVTFALGRREFACYDPVRRDWAVDSGTYEVLVGGSSRDLSLKAEVAVESDTPPLIHKNSIVEDWLAHPRGREIVRELLGRLTVMKSQGLDVDKPEMLARIRRRPLLKYVLLEGMSEAEFDDLIERANG